MTDHSSDAPKIALQNVTKVFETPRGTVEAVTDVCYQIKTNEIVCIVGPSGCGKSTLLNLVAGFLLPTEGQVLIDGQPVRGPGADRAVVFQGDAVFPWLTVAENVEYGLKARGIPVAERRDIVDRVLRLVGLTDYKTLYPRQLSGGMKKRADLARAYANQPEVLLMDEPFGALDVLTKENMQQELLRLWKRETHTVMFITHDIEEALFIGHRVLVMTPRPGRIAKGIQVPFEKEPDLRIKISSDFQNLRQAIIDILGQAESDQSGDQQ